MMIRDLKKIMKDPYYVIGKKVLKHCPKLMPDRYYLKVMWKQWMGYELDLEHPKTFNEKLQWLKLYDRKPEYTMMVDKFRVKQWVADKIGEQYVIPTLAVYGSVDEIDLDELPDQFVLKCNHDSGSVVVCKDKSAFDLDAAKKKLSAGLKQNFYWHSREWPYKRVKRCIVAEQYLQSGEDDLIDYKLMVFSGEVKCSFTCTKRNKGEGLKVTFFDSNWKKMPFERRYPSDTDDICKPVSYGEMVRVAEKLCESIPFSRVDFYEIEGKPYFGEMTFFPGAGFEEFEPREWDAVLGDWIKLPTDKH